MWNNPNDPMPIKTTNMAGLQKWEETEDYIIYLCKDAVMTTSEKGVNKSTPTVYECCFKVNKKSGEIYSVGTIGALDGKLTFVTEANETTHTFLAKNELSFNESTILKTVLGATSNPVLTIEETETVNWIGGTTNEI